MKTLASVLTDIVCYQNNKKRERERERGQLLCLTFANSMKIGKGPPSILIRLGETKINRELFSFELDCEFVHVGIHVIVFLRPNIRRGWHLHMALSISKAIMKPMGAT
ncbi:SAM domain-containing protein [Psidium guajava]|nr:SAM domain-containing protein [Psidium guajava]